MSMIVLQVFLLGKAFAESKSGVDPQVISLPKGPGSIEGLGESFEPQLNTGTATYRIKIAVSPGVNKHQPDVALEYNGGYGNSPLGLGWNLNLEYIQRQTDKGLPAYTNDDTFICSKSGELVPLEDDIYRLKIEGPFMKFQKIGDAWEALRKNGTHLYFGSSPLSRLTTANGIFQWVIDKEVDTNGNEIRYFYQLNGGQVYLSEIRYSIMSDTIYKSVRFVYEDRPDDFTDYHSRAKILTAKRLAAIEAISNGTLVRKYQLEYQQGTEFSLLSKIIQVGADGQSALPPVTFDYTTYNPENIQTIPMTNPPPVGISLSNNNVDLVDIDGDSLPDIVHTDPGYGLHNFYLNEGRGEWAAGFVTPDASPQHFLASDGVMMSDMNGDGLSDLFVKNDDTFGYFKNKGDVKWEEADWQPCTPNPNFSFESQSVRLVDVNNDKLIDVIVDANDASYNIWLNRKNNQWSDAFDSSTQLPGGSHLDFSSPYVKMGDMNGDRMEDLVYILNGYVSYFPSMGNGDFDAETEMFNPPAGIADAMDRVAVSDINNDGLSDIVLIGNENIMVWFNAGANIFKDPALSEGTPPYIGGASAFRFADMNGDGFTDLLMIDANSVAPYQYVDFNSGIHPNLLTKISNGLGREIAISYKSSTQYYLDDRDNGKEWTTKLPFPVYVVSNVTVKDGKSGDEYVTDYVYRNGYYDGAEKEFRGFGEVEKITYGDPTAPTLKSHYIFDVGKDEESRKGMVKSLSALDENGAINPPLGLFDIQNNSLVTSELHTGTNGERVRFSYISKADSFFYENTLSPKQTHQEFVQDIYGNTTEESNYGLVESGDLSAGKDEVRTFTTYLIDEANWMVDRPTSIRKIDFSGAFVSHQKNSYDAKGNLIKQEGAITAGNFNTMLENTYDSYGNVITMTDGNSHWRAIGYDPVFHTFPVSERIDDTGLTMTAGYDTGIGVITSFTDFNLHATTFGYDTFGRLTSIVKPGDSFDLPTQQFIYTLANPVSSVMTKSRESFGMTDTYDAITYYDGLGRKLQTKSEGTSGRWVVSDAVTFNQQGTAKGKWLPYFSDSMSCEIPDPANPHINVEYDAKGRSIKEINPDATFKTTMYLPLQNTVSDEEDNGAGPHANTPHSFINDGLNRLVEVLEQNDDQTYVTRYEYDGQNNLTKIIDDKGNIKTMDFDGLGRKTYMDDPDKHEMFYTYDPVGNLISTTDAKGQVVSYTYDPANRILTEELTTAAILSAIVSSSNSKIPLNPPLQKGDLASTTLIGDSSYSSPLQKRETTYPPSSNHLSSLPPLTKGGGGDLSSSSSPSSLAGNSFSSPSPLGGEGRGEGLAEATGVKVRYHYDAELPAAYPNLSNTLGKLSYVEDEAGKEYYAYDARGNTVVKIREAQGYTFINKMAYDAMDRMTAMTYPDGFTVHYQYNAMNQLSTIPGFVSGIDYIATGQKSRFEYENGIISNYQYDIRQRMKNLKSQKTGKTLQDFSYAYDAVSNITQISDGRPEKTTEDQTRTFAYDDLYRLTSAIAPAWTETYQYNSIGNMMFKSDVGAMTYGENSAGPHAVTTAHGAGITYAYDGNGNIAAKTPGYTYQFDHKDRMSGANRLTDNANMTYTYDYKGNRVTKSTQLGETTSTTVYADKFTELRQNTLIKQVFAGDRMVARISTPFTPTVIETRLNPLTIDDFDKNPKDGVISLVEIRAQGDDPGKVEAPDAADALRIYLDNLDANPNVISFETMAKALHELGGIPPQAETVYFYLPDHLGSASIVTDKDGNVVEESIYYPYGSDRARTGSFESEYRFTGKELDDETGLHYFGARYYDSQVGRFVSVDPLLTDFERINQSTKLSLLNQLAFNKSYSYSANQPTRKVDATGYWGQDVHQGEMMQTYGTNKWALDSGFSIDDAYTIAKADNEVDHMIGFGPVTCQGRHFNDQSLPIDSRLTYRDIEMAEAKRQLALGNRDNALIHLGYAIHSVQDIESHSDDVVVRDPVTGIILHDLSKNSYVDDFNASNLKFENSRESRTRAKTNELLNEFHDYEQKKHHQIKAR